MKPARRGVARSRQEWPAVVYMWAFGLSIGLYVLASLLLDGQPHPYHWAAAILGGLAGIPIGWAWYRWRGDVF